MKHQLKTKKVWIKNPLELLAKDISVYLTNIIGYFPEMLFLAVQ